MCGICGLAGSSPQGEIMDAMLRRLGHRGPDNTGALSDGLAALGHTRLSIIDLSESAHQPMVNEDRTLWLTANGEIYNSPELRAGLEALGHRFRSRSDCEVLLHLYEEEGSAFLPRLNGMFAFAIWDVGRRRLLLARDRMGIKPLYYHVAGETLLFASEIKALAAIPTVSTGISATGLKQYLTHENTFGAATLHRGIRMVEPGQCLLWERGKTHTRNYWRPRITEDAAAPGFEDACAVYQNVAARAVRRHMMSDVEVAAYLSGGFDSPTVATLAADDTTEGLSTFTGAFRRGGWYDETAGAGAVARAIGSRHTEVRMDASDLAEVMDDLIYALDEPRMGTGAFSQYMVAREAAKRVKVILTGHGGDELFGGYPVFKLVHLARHFRTQPVNALRELARVRLAEWPHLVYFMGRRLGGADSAAEFLPVLFTEPMLKLGLQPDVHERLRGVNPLADLERILGREADPYHRLCMTYLRAYLPGLFVVEDKISMAHTLESRVPLCDNELVETALSWPLKLKLHGGTLKAIPKAGMRDRLPKVLYRQPKRGFPTPLSHWLRHELRPWAEERLLTEGSSLHRLFRPEYLRRMAAAYFSSPRRHLRPLDEIQTHRMWMLLSLEAWLRVSEERLGRKLEFS